MNSLTMLTVAGVVLALASASPASAQWGRNGEFRGGARGQTVVVGQRSFGHRGDFQRPLARPMAGRFDRDGDRWNRGDERSYLADERYGRGQDCDYRGYRDYQPPCRDGDVTYSSCAPVWREPVLCRRETRDEVRTRNALLIAVALAAVLDHGR